MFSNFNPLDPQYQTLNYQVVEWDSHQFILFSQMHTINA